MTLAAETASYKMFGKDDFNLELSEEERYILSLVWEFA